VRGEGEPYQHHIVPNSCAATSWVIFSPACSFSEYRRVLFYNSNFFVA
jgi:hypothetical protein